MKLPPIVEMERPGSNISVGTSEDMLQNISHANLSERRRQKWFSNNDKDNTIAEVKKLLSSSKIEPESRALSIKSMRHSSSFDSLLLTSAPSAELLEANSRNPPKNILRPISPRKKYEISTDVQFPIPIKEPQQNLDLALKDELSAIMEASFSMKINDLAILAFLQDRNMLDTFQTFANEADIPEKICNNMLLRSWMYDKEYSKALDLVQRTMLKTCDETLKHSFDDLIYVLAKYLVIHMYEANIKGSDEVLAMVLWPLVEKAQYIGGMRANWFTKDFELLQDIATGNPKKDNIYLNFNWSGELDKFWNSIDIRKQHNSNAPLFSHALRKFFGGTQIKYEKLENMAAEAEKFRIIKKALLNFHPPTGEQRNYENQITEIKIVNNPRQRRYRKAKGNPKAFPLDNGDETLIPPIPPSSTNGTDSSKYTISHRSETSNHRLSYNTQEEAKLPQASANENASFALVAVSGPSIGPIQVLAVNSITETGQIIAATSGGEDRSDKRICIWDLRTDELLSQLDNQTTKPVTSLQFHPSFPNLLLSADMACDVKLWNWKESRTVRWWKKHHSRIIYQLGYVPGDDTRAVSCSGDQSLRIWNIHSDKANRGSIHANEPITSFVFCGSETDPHQQKIIVSLSSSLRIYKLRTLQLLHTINLKDIKASNSQIHYIMVHPVYDNFILISCDHQIRLFNLDGETVVKTYNARQIEDGVRLKASFSPCGNYIYAGPCDTRPGMERKTNYEDYSHLIWRVHSGKLESHDMAAMDHNGAWEHKGAVLKSSPSSACIWINVTEKNKNGNQITKRKAFVSGGVDKLIRLYM